MDLMLNYDGYDTEIAMITFDIQPFEDDSYIYFGRFEVDYLAVNKSLQIIVLLQDELEGHVLCYCAQNSSKFLTAIYLAACY